MRFLSGACRGMFHLPVSDLFPEGCELDIFNKISIYRAYYASGFIQSDILHIMYVSI